MEIEQLLRCLLFQEIFEYFDLVGIKEEDKQIELSLDEKPIKPIAHSGKELVLYGFDEAVRIQDFPIRGPERFTAYDGVQYPSACWSKLRDAG